MVTLHHSYFSETHTKHSLWQRRIKIETFLGIKMNDITNHLLVARVIWRCSKKKCTLHACLSSSSSVHHIPDEVRLMRWAPSLGAAGLAARPRPEDKGFALVVGGGAAMAAQGSSSSDCTVFFKFNGLEVVAG